MIARLGSRKYKVNRHWAKLPESVTFNHVSSININSREELLVLQRSQPFLLIFSKEGNLIDTWIDESVIDGHNLYVTKDDNIIIVDRDYHRIAIFDVRGKCKGFIGEKDNPGLPGRPFNNPTDISRTKDGSFFVTDGYGNSCVHHFDHQWNLVQTWGEKGSGNGQFSAPHAIAVDDDDCIYVTDRENNRVQIFNQHGYHLQTISDVYHPMDIFIDDDGLIYITDQTPSLNVFDLSGTFKGRCRTFGTYGHGITVDEDKSIYIAEMFPDGITKLEKMKD